MKQLKQILTGLCIGANLCTLLLLWLCCLSTHLPPQTFPILSLLGLTFPILLCINIASILFWILFNPRMTLIPLIGIALTWSFIRDYIPINQTHEHLGERIKVFSFNVGGITSAEGYEALAQYLKQEQPDIICLQEVSAQWIKTVQKDLGDSTYHFDIVQNKCILSRMPLLGKGKSIAYPTRSNGSIVFTLKYHNDSILVINNHLESNHLTKDEREGYKDILRGKEQDEALIKARSRNLIERLAESGAYRGEQTDTLLQFIRSSTIKSIIMCGDFNDTPISYTCRKLSSQLHSAYRESGNGVGFSYREKGFFVRIDHVMISEDWTSALTFIDQKCTLSDHYPIITYLYKSSK